MRKARFAALVLCIVAAPDLRAQIAVSANDGKVTLVNGNLTVVENPPADTVAFIDLSGASPRLIAEIEAPSSVMGPPVNVAISPDGRLALVSAAFKIDDKKAHVPDNRISVIDLKSSPPRVVGTVTAGASPSGMSFTPDGRMVLVANRSDGTVSVFRVEGMDLRNVGTVTIGSPTSGPSHVVITPDGKTALVTRDGDSTISALAIDGDKVAYNKRDLFAGVRPYGIVMTPDGKTAVAAMVGRGVGDTDVIATIDMTGKWPRVVDHMTIGMTPEGISMSSDGKLVAVTVVNGSNKAKDWPWYQERGKVVLLRLDGTKLTKLSEAPVGAWVQGSGFSADNKTLIVQNILDKQLQVLRIGANGQLQDNGERIALKAGPVGLRVAGAP